ncbi:MAG: hypothetical protein BIP78_0931 [Candidatus Bipolaricaulis sibiricus]|uniref:HTH araC/xylS-type domain-containing protein n=1 Tax=Bipolaricaulis sibiricus TaxID=2501609 RepID=A0A410FUD7_BIPS1|nr:MAG: hypothetical protein BIP78_0931 [Candidatus Bipolaricaulis sibiricus]
MGGPTEVHQVSRQEDERRVERVLPQPHDHLAGDLSLHTLARVANFSPYHFHRGFRAIVGEPVGTFVRRLRVLTAAHHLAEDRARPITANARACGVLRVPGLPPAPRSVDRRLRASHAEKFIRDACGPIRACDRRTVHPPIP